MRDAVLGDISNSWDIYQRALAHEFGLAPHPFIED